jgi:thioredoxin-dependent peroxiredoxin
MKSIMVSMLLVLPWLAGSVLATGANPEDFTLKSATTADTFQLDKNKGKVVVLHFLLKTECPLCLAHTRAYAKYAAGHPDQIHLFIKPDSEAEIKEWTKHLDDETRKTTPPIYRDPDAGLAKQFNISYGYKFHGETVHYPALVALGTNGQELFRYVGKSNSDRLKLKDFEAKLAALAK